jgi:hydroxymethylpyrimidine/phosphomethylpyrimidine kinase
MDPSGGAGILRDAVTLSALGVHAMAISTAETLQNGQACERIEAPSMDPLRRLESLSGHLTGNWGVKLGMCALPSRDLERLVARIEELAPPIQIWDPILAPTSGPELHDEDGLRAMARAILPGGRWIVTPNRQEAGRLAVLDPEADPGDLAEPFLALGAGAVWLKGGHAQGRLVQDHWVTRTGCTSFDPVPRLPGERRGTGCALAAAWLGFRLLGDEELSAARRAADWLRSRWGSCLAPGGLGRPLFLPLGAS